MLLLTLLRCVWCEDCVTWPQDEFFLGNKTVRRWTSYKQPSSTSTRVFFHWFCVCMFIVFIKINRPHWAVGCFEWRQKDWQAGFQCSELSWVVIWVGQYWSPNLLFVWGLTVSSSDTTAPISDLKLNTQSFFAYMPMKTLHTIFLLFFRLHTNLSSCPTAHTYLFTRKICPFTAGVPVTTVMSFFSTVRKNTRSWVFIR